MHRPRATGTEGFRRPLPEQRVALDVERTFSHDEFISLSLGYIPRGPGDKWYIVMGDDRRLHFYRSQTGTCIYEAALEPVDEGYRLGPVYANRDVQQYRNQDADYDAALLLYLVDRFLMGRWLPLPLPRDMPQEHRDTHRGHVIGDVDDRGSIPLDLTNGKSG